MASIKEVVTHMYNVGESKDRILAVINAHKKNEAKKAEEMRLAKNIASQLAPITQATQPKTTVPVVIENDEVKDEVIKKEQKPVVEHKKLEPNPVTQSSIVDQTQNPNQNVPVINETEEEAAESQEYANEFFAEENNDVKKENSQANFGIFEPEDGEVNADSFNDISWFQDTEVEMTNILNTKYEGLGYDIKVIDKVGRFDVVEMRDPKTGVVHKIRRGEDGFTPKMLANINDFHKNAQLKRQELYDAKDYANKSREQIEEEQKVDVTAVDNYIKDEMNGGRKNDLKEVINSEPIISQKSIDAQAELDLIEANEKEKSKYTTASDDEAETEEEHNYIDLKELRDKQKAILDEVERRRQQHIAYLKTQGIEEGTEEYDREMSKHDFKGLSHLSDTEVDKFQEDKSKQDIVDMALKNLTTADSSKLKGGVTQDFLGEGEVHDHKTWTEEELDLLNGLSWEEIEKLAGKTSWRSDGSIYNTDGGAYTHDMKEEQINKAKSVKMDTDLSRYTDKIKQSNKEGEEIEKSANSLVAQRKALEGDLKTFNDTALDLKKDITVFEGNKVKKEEELQESYKAIESMGVDENSTQPEIDAYNKAIREHQVKVDKYNNFVNTGQKKYDKYNKHVKGGDALQKRSDGVNSKLDTLKLRDEKYRLSADNLQEEYANTAAQYSFNIAEGVFANNFEITKEYKDWRNRHVGKDDLAVGEVRDFGNTLLQGIGQSAIKYYAGTGLWVNQVFDGALDLVGADSYGQRAGQYDAMDQLEFLYEKYSNYDLAGASTGDAYEGLEGQAFGKGSKMVANMLPFTLAIMASAKRGNVAGLNGAMQMLGKKALSPEWMSKIKMAETAFRMTVMDSTLEGREMGLTDAQSMFYGGTQATITGMVQMIMPDVNFLGRGAGEAAVTGFVANLKRATTKKGMEVVGKTYIQNLLGEFAEEEVELLLSDVTKIGFGLSHATEFTDMEVQKQTILGTFLLTSTLAPMQITNDMKAVRGKVYTQYKKNGVKIIKNLQIDIDSNVEAYKTAEAKGDTEAMAVYKQNIDQLVKTKNHGEAIMKAVNVSPEYVSDDQLALVTKKQELISLKDGTDKAFHAEIDAEIEGIDAEIQNSQIVKNKMEAAKDENGNPLFSPANIKEAIQGHGFVDPETNTIYMNTDMSLESNINTAAHEYLHRAMWTTLGMDPKTGKIENTKAAIAIGNSLGDYLLDLDPEQVADSNLRGRLSSYQNAPTNVQAQEMVTLASDAMMSGEFDFQEGVMTKVGDGLRRGLQDMGMKVKFNTGKDVFNFVKDFNNSVKKGKLNKAQKAFIDEGAEIGGEIGDVIAGKGEAGALNNLLALEDQLAVEKDTEKRLQLLKDNNINPTGKEGKRLMSSKDSNVQGLLDENAGNVRKMINTTLSKTPDGQDSFSFDNPMVRSKFGQEIMPIVEATTKRLFDGIPVSERNGITRGSFQNDLVAMAAGIVEKEFKVESLGEGQNIDNFISNRLNLRANKLASDLGIESTVEHGGLGATLGLDQAKEIEGDAGVEAIVSTTPAVTLIDRIANRKQKNALKALISNSISGDLITMADGTVKNINDLDYGSLTDLAPALTCAMFGVNNVNNYTDPKKALKNEDVINARMFVAKNSELLYNMLPKGVTESGTSTLVRPRLLKEFYNKSDKRVSYDKKEGGAGIFPFIKKKLSATKGDGKLTIEQFEEVFGVKKGEIMVVKGQMNYNTVISALMNEVGKLNTNQAVRKHYENVGDVDQKIAKQAKFLGDGRSELMFSKAVRTQMDKDPVVGIEIIEELREVTPAMVKAAGGDIKKVIDVKFAKQIADGAFDSDALGRRKPGATQKILDKVAADLQGYYDKLVQGDKRITATTTYDGTAVSDIAIDQMINDSINDAASYNSILKGITGQELQSINDPDVAAQSREGLVKVGDRLAEKHNRGWVERFITPSFSHVGRVANGSHNFRPGNISVFEKNGDYDGSRNRFNLTEGVDDARYLLGTSKGNTGEFGKQHSVTYAGNLKAIPNADTQKEIVKEQRENNKAFREVVETMREMYEDGDITAQQIIHMLRSMNANPQCLTRTAAILDWMPADIDYSNDLLRLEHMTPALQVNLQALNYILSGDNDSKADFTNTMDGYKAAYIPKSYDDVINGFYKSTLPVYTDAMSPSIFRYYNLETLGMFDLEMTQISTGNTIGGGFALDKDAQQKLKNDNLAALGPIQLLMFSKGDSNSEMNRKGTILDRAIKKSRLNGPRRGLSAWDFDDTLARTKSGVRAKIPNPDFTPKPGRKVIFMAGGAGSGKSNIIKQSGFLDQGYKVVNSDISLEWLKKNNGLPESMEDLTPEQLSQLGKLQWEARQIAKRKQMKYKGNGDGVVVDGTGGSVAVMEKQIKEFKDAGYDVQMVYVETSQEVALERNKNRKERSLREDIVIKNHEKVQGNKEAFKGIFGDNFAEVNTNSLNLGDAMPSTLTDKLNKFTKSYENRRLTAEEFATEGEAVTEAGGEFDFAEFDVVTEGEQGPLFNKAMNSIKKFGSKDQFVITARPHAAKKAIAKFLQAQGLDISEDNIVTLQDSSPEAKALWIAEKVGDGYNDIYFADDALQNVEAVDNMLKQFDVKGEVQQAKRLMFSKASDTFNEILEQTTGTNKFTKFSDAKANKRGQQKGKYKFFIPPSAEDFKGLIYQFLGKGKQGEAHMQFFQDNLLDPFARATREIDALKQKLTGNFKGLKKAYPEASKKLKKTIPSGDFTYDTAVRVYNWVKNGYEVPGLSKADQKNLIAAVEADASLMGFANGLQEMTNGYPEPSEYWMTESVPSDLYNMSDGSTRKEALGEFSQNREQILGTWKNGKLVGPNMNKIEAIYGSNFREAMEDMLWRMENGTNRSFGSNRLTNQFANWVNNSVGAIMFLNMRSAALQTLSSVNFVNWSDNNPIAAAKALANFPQFIKDFSTLFNSDMLKERRSGLKTSVSHAELAEAVSGSKNPVKAIFQKLLKLGFTPTQIADSFAIASGGATFYRNRVNTLLKTGMSQVEAEKQAFADFQAIAEETQQSSRPDMISQQQASPLGRLILAFQNTPMQYTRLMKKSILDLANGRGDRKTHVSKILYYGAIQNIIFSSLQKALFAFAFDDDDEEDKARQKKKELSIANGMLDSVLRGMGVGGAIVSTLKNMILKFFEQEGKGHNADDAKIIIEMLNLSPPIGSKARKLNTALKTLRYKRDAINSMPLNDIDNPIWEVVGNIISSTTNLPMDRVVSKVKNIQETCKSEHEMWQRVALIMGYHTYDLGVENTDVNAAMDVAREKKAEEKKAKKKLKEKKEKEKIAEEKRLKGIREVQCSAHIRKGKGPRCGNKTENKNGKCYAHQ